MSGPFQAGDVVVCVDISTVPGWMDVPGYAEAIAALHLGRAYRVLCCRYWEKWAEGGGYAVEIDGPNAPAAPDWPGMPIGWGPQRFRKIEAPKSEIADLIRACKPAKVKA